MANEVNIKDVGRQTAKYWLDAALVGDEQQVSNQFEVLKEAAIHILGTYAFNRIKQDRVSETYAVMELKEEVEDEVQFMKNEFESNNVKLSQAKQNESN